MSDIRQVHTPTTTTYVPHSEPLAFHAMGNGYCGPTSNGGSKKFVAITVDYFTKWAKIEALSKIGQPDMKNFVWRNIVCRFGVPDVLITENGM